MKLHKVTKDDRTKDVIRKNKPKKENKYLILKQHRSTIQILPGYQRKTKESQLYKFVCMVFILNIAKIATSKCK